MVLQIALGLSKMYWEEIKAIKSERLPNTRYVWSHKVDVEQGVVRLTDGPFIHHCLGMDFGSSTINYDDIKLRLKITYEFDSKEIFVL